MQCSSRPKAYATAKPRAPDGKQTRTALDHSLTLRIAAPREAAIVSGTGPVLAMSVRPPPVPKHPGTALLRRMNGFPRLGFTSGCFGVEQASTIWFAGFLGERRKQNAPGFLTRGRSRGLGRSG